MPLLPIMISPIVFLLFCRSVLGVGLESQVTSSAESVQDIFTSTSEFTPEITIEAQAGRVNFSGIISLAPILSASVEQTAVAASRPSSLFISVSNQTSDSNSSAISLHSSPQPTAARSSLIFNHSVVPQGPTASLITFTSSASRSPRLYHSRVALLFLLGVMQM
jgi:hypothetical protein